ncbi:MAG: hypothetical protein CM15mP77_2170 [Synechococcus sp.]|nr:MAG: hypothetical protein CM15mP77_2170 [Synechococcus sp.]
MVPYKMVSHLGVWSGALQALGSPRREHPELTVPGAGISHGPVDA